MEKKGFGAGALLGIGCLFCLVLALGTIYTVRPRPHAALGNTIDDEVKRSQQAAQLSDEHASSRAIEGRKLLSDKSVQRAMNLLVATQDRTALEARIDGLALTEAEQKLLSQIKPTGPGGPEYTKIQRALIMANHYGEIPEGEGLADIYARELQQDPDRSVPAIVHTIEAMPTDQFLLERMLLLQHLSRYPSAQDTVRGLAQDQLTRTIAADRGDPRQARSEADLDRTLSATDSTTAIIMTHRTYLAVTSDADQAMSTTLNGIRQQADRGVRISMINQYIEKFPDHRDDLNRELSNSGLGPDSL